VMRGLAWANRPHSAATRQEARRAFEQALEVDPGSVDARVGIALILVRNISDGWSGSLEQDGARAEQLLREALEHNPNHSMARAVMGNLRRIQNRLSESHIELEVAVTLNHNYASAFYQLGQTLIFLGRPEVAVPHVERAIRLNPRDPNLAGYYWALGSCHLLFGHADQAIHLLRTARARNPRYWYIHLWLAGALGLGGELDDARLALAEGTKLAPEISSLARWRTHSPWITNPQYVMLAAKTLHVGLGRAGFPVE
jgi:adenylate cyclase